jgi:RNA polymerase sigma-70 factor (ECF subfamily)
MADREPEFLTDGGRRNSAASDLWRRLRDYTPSSGNEECWVLTTQAVEKAVARSERGGLGNEKRALPVKLEMDIAEESHDARRVRQALASISVEQRTALELAYWGGLSPAEIGERTDLPLEIVNKRLELALLNLGDLLAKD